MLRDHPCCSVWPRFIAEKARGVGVALSLALSALVFQPVADAQTFQALTLDGGGHTSGFDQANDGRLYAFGDVFGAWRSDNGGDDWSYLNWSIPGGANVGYGITVQKDNSDVVYYYSYAAIHKSTNGGTTWSNILSPLGDNNPRFRGTSAVMIRANNPNEIWFSGPRQNLTGWLWRSNDGGLSWNKAGGTAFDSNRARTLHNIAEFPNQIWVGADDGLHVSTNGGGTFTRVSTHPEVGMIQRFKSGPNAGVGLITRASVNGDGGGISRITATNFGDASTYTATQSTTTALFFGYPTGLQIFSDGTASAWNTSADRHGFSNNGGIGFTNRNTSLILSPVPVWTTVTQMAAENRPNYGSDQVIEDVTNPNKWIITGGGAAMFSMDKGLSWRYFPNGRGIAAVKTYVPRVSRFDPNRIYIPGSDIGSAIVTDGGASGLPALSSNKSFNSLHGCFAVMEGPDTQNLVIAGVSQGTNSNLLLRSSNGGVNWSQVNLAGSGLPTSLCGITKSVMSLNDANDFLVVLASDTVVAGPHAPGSINPGVWRTTNGGTSFSQVQNLPVASLSTGDRYHPQNCHLDRDAIQANVRYFVSRGEPFYKSTNGGTNWSAVTHPFGLGTWVWSMMADPIRTNNIWVAGEGGGVKVSRDGGQSWTSTAQDFNSQFVSSCDGKVAIWGKAIGDVEPRLYFSDDDGATFTAQTTPAKNFHGVQGITVDRNGKIWVSWNSCTVVTPIGATLIAPTIIGQPANVTVSTGASASFNVSAAGTPAPDLQWQRAPNGSGVFTNLTNGGSYSGVTGNQLTISNSTLGMSGDQFRAVATNSQGTATSNSATLTVLAPPVPVIQTGQNISGNIGVGLSYQIIASNSPSAYALTSGSLPAGLSLNTTTGIISGSPSALFGGSPTFTATNAGGNSSAVAIAMNIAAAPTAIHEPFGYTAGAGALANKNGGSLWTSAWDSGANDLNATGLTYASGGTLQTSGGRADIRDGTANYRTLRSGAYPNGTYWISLLARHPTAPANTWGGLSLYNGGSETFFIGQRYGQAVWGLERNGVGVSSGTSVANSTFIVVKIVLQPGNDQVRLFTNPSLAATPADNTGVLLDNVADFSFDRIRLMHGLGSGQTMQIDEIRFGDSFAAVAPVVPPAPVITSSLVQNGTVGTGVSYTITGSNTPTSFAATGLPAGLALNTATGLISGTPTTSGTFNTNISAINVGGTGTATLVFTLAQQTALMAFRAFHGLNPSGSEDDLTPANDDVPNLLKFAFNLIGTGPGQAPNLTTPNSGELPAGGIAGLPAVGTEAGTGNLQLTYVRRRASSSVTGITYTVQFSTDLGISDPWAVNPSATESVTSIDSTFERVVLTDAFTSSAPRRFVRVEVVAIP